MPVRELSSMTWEDVASLEAGRAIGILPVGATEAHGPHLPLGTDVVIAGAMARVGAERLVMLGWEPLLLPPLTYTAAPYAAGFAGTVTVRAELVTGLVVDIARSLGAHGVRALAVANAHLDPAHVRALRAAAAELEGDDVVLVFPDITRRALAERLTEEFRGGACHAGRYEGSIVLAERPELVRDEVRRALPPVDRSLIDAMREGRHTFEEAGGDRAYFGDPAAATAEEGRLTVAALGEILTEAVTAELGEPGERWPSA